MPTLDCGHLAGEARRVCPHVLAGPDADYVQSFTGRGKAFDLLCAACTVVAEGERRLVTACPACFEGRREAGSWEGIIGRPEVLQRPSALHFTHQTVRLPGLASDPLLDVRPVEGVDQERWVGVTRSGLLVGLDLERGSSATLCRLPASGVDLAEPVSLHLSPCARLAAVVNTRGRSGLVVELDTGRPTLGLDRGGYHTEHSVFPAAFVEAGGRPLLIHGTEWNRLDVSDARTGELLTPRTHAPYRPGQPRPEHYLDYFHGGLSVSPGEYVADNGWAWSPTGIVTTWSARRWLAGNVWESEDGASRKQLCWRSYFWDGPLCWVADDRLAVWGYGQDDEWLVPAARVFDVTAGEEVRWFAGPAGEMVFDRNLFCFGGKEGAPMSVWDVDTGELLLQDDPFCPMRYHRGAKAFLTLMPGGAFQVSKLRGRPLGPGWLTAGGGAAARVAAGIAAARDFASLPVLADALLEAGYEDEEMLAHCRRPGPHGGRCWVVDWLLEGE